jgi:hypothetical protein
MKRMLGNLDSMLCIHVIHTYTHTHTGAEDWEDSSGIIKASQYRSPSYGEVCIWSCTTVCVYIYKYTHTHTSDHVHVCL